jgi:hypothetical protein
MWNITNRIQRQSLTTVAEFYVEFKESRQYVPSYLHYSLRLFDLNGNFVQRYNGLIVNSIPTGQRTLTRQIQLGQTSNSSVILQESIETPGVQSVPSGFLDQEGMGFEMIGYCNP